MVDFDEDEMLNTPATIVPCRGREGKLETDVCEPFTAKDLDQIAPLAPGDAKDLADNYYSLPSCETMARLAKRIQAARRLKYGS